MYTIGKVAQQFKISRSTLLYYDRIGLLMPSDRSKTNYRLYTEQDVNKLSKILFYREAGLSLEEIKTIVPHSTDEDKAKLILEKRLYQINKEMRKLRNQQQIILEMIKENKLIKQTHILNKTAWVALLRHIGLSDKDMDNWHIAFEQMAPEAHQDFLESLGLDHQEIFTIRQYSQLNHHQ